MQRSSFVSVDYFCTFVSNLLLVPWWHKYKQTIHMLRYCNGFRIDSCKPYSTVRKRLESREMRESIDMRLTNLSQMFLTSSLHIWWRVLLRACSSLVILFNSVDSNYSVGYSSPFLLVLDSEEEKCEICISDTCFSKSFLLLRIFI